jgi:hypothetical protein
MTAPITLEHLKMAQDSLRAACDTNDASWVWNHVAHIDFALDVAVRAFSVRADQIAVMIAIDALETIRRDLDHWNGGGGRAIDTIYPATAKKMNRALEALRFWCRK